MSPLISPLRGPVKIAKPKSFKILKDIVDIEVQLTTVVDIEVEHQSKKVPCSVFPRKAYFTGIQAKIGLRDSNKADIGRASSMESILVRI